jgi:hypothetical protein
MATTKPRKGAERRATSATKPKPTPTHDEVAKRAYERFLARGATDGRAGEDWLEAERELQQALMAPARRASRSVAASARNRT